MPLAVFNFCIAPSLLYLDKSSRTDVAKSWLLHLLLAEFACKFASGW
jgi:hypothetical protein